MNVIPIQTGLLYMLLITEVFEIKTLYYFETYLNQFDFKKIDFNCTLYSLVKKIYKQTL